MSICWYQDKNLKIVFDNIPRVSIRYITPLSSEEEIEQINKKPFINLANLNVNLNVEEPYFREKV